MVVRQSVDERSRRAGNSRLRARRPRHGSAPRARDPGNTGQPTLRRRRACSPFRIDGEITGCAAGRRRACGGSARLSAAQRSAPQFASHVRQHIKCGKTASPGLLRGSRWPAFLRRLSWHVAMIASLSRLCYGGAQAPRRMSLRGAVECSVCRVVFLRRIALPAGRGRVRRPLVRRGRQNGASSCRSSMTTTTTTTHGLGMSVARR